MPSTKWPTSRITSERAYLCGELGWNRIRERKKCVLIFLEGVSNERGRVEGQSEFRVRANFKKSGQNMNFSLPGIVTGLVDRREAAGKRLVEQLLQDGPHVLGEGLARAHVHRGFVDFAWVRHVGRLE